jgi:two-component system chemotaxis response regulator CheB
MVTQLAQPPLKLRRDIIVIGCSAGGVEALPHVIEKLPLRFGAAVFVVMHMAPSRDPYLVEILRRRSVLPVTWAEQGEQYEAGHIYVAPPDVHLLFNQRHLQLARSARENHSRPSIDKLFRSAAATHGPRVAAVLMTGMLDDGVAGLVDIRATGGTVIVQDPKDARFPDLPAHAVAALVPDHLLALDAIGDALIAVAQGDEPAAVPTPRHIAIEAAFDQRGIVTPAEMSELGPQTPHVCPDCEGPMWNVGSPQARRFRCYNGHVRSARQLITANEEQVEVALWTALRALDDKASTLETMADDATKTGNESTAASYAERARDARKQAELLRRFVTDLGTAPSA